MFQTDPMISLGGAGGSVPVWRSGDSGSNPSPGENLSLNF